MAFKSKSRCFLEFKQTFGVKELAQQYSPSAYQCTDYDSMGNHGRFPKQKPTSKSSLEKI
jgi:hypothetical protein